LNVALVLAQNPESLTSLSGGAGWVGAGLLGLVLSWLLFFHLPAKDRQLKEMIETHNILVASLHRDCQNERTAQFMNYKETLDSIALRTAATQDKWAKELGDELKTLREALVALRVVVAEWKKTL
jgi:thiamine kinase-like enzyme